MATEPSPTAVETSFLFGRLTWAALPLHEPILVATFVVVALGGVALLAALTYFRLWGYLWHEWFTSRRPQEDRDHVHGPRPRHAAARLRRRGDDAAAAGLGLQRLRGLPDRRTTTTRSSPPTASS